MLSTRVSFQPLRDVFEEVSNGCCWSQDQERGQDLADGNNNTDGRPAATFQLDR